jgi:hypothetical protein
MTSERMAALVARWVRLYTRNLPAPIAQRRIEEIDADLHDHIAHDRAQGTSEWRTALSIAVRAVRGIAADAAWHAQFSTRKEVSMSKSLIRVALATALILLVPLVAMQVSEDATWSLFDFVFAGALIAGTGLLLELAARKPRALGYRAAVAAIGVAAIAFGEADDAPGLVLFGCLLILGTVALTVRTALRSH